MLGAGDLVCDPTQQALPQTAGWDPFILFLDKPIKSIMEPGASIRPVGSGVRSVIRAFPETVVQARAGHGPSHCPHAGRAISLTLARGAVQQS